VGGGAAVGGRTTIQKAEHPAPGCGAGCSRMFSRLLHHQSHSGKVFGAEPKNHTSFAAGQRLLCRLLVFFRQLGFQCPASVLLYIDP
jgi:hypothetical protein